MKPIHSDSRRSKRLLGSKELLFAVFLTAGYFKADPRFSWLPIDLTLLAALGTVGLVIWSFSKHRFRLPTAVFVMLPLFALFLPSITVVEWHDYSAEKTIRFFTLTLLATIAPLFLIKSQEELCRLCNALALIGIIMAINALASLILQGEQVLRLTAFSSNTIALGRAVGLALVWFSMLALEGRLSLLIASIGIVVLGFVLLSAGSRGPLIATTLGILLTFMLFRWHNVHRTARLTMMILITVSSVYVTFQLIPETSLQRIESFLGGDFGASEQLRFQAYALSWDTIRENPLGIGLGGFTTAINLWDVSRQYPHNIVIETLLEGGWLAGIYLVILLALSLLRVYSLGRRHKESPEFIILFAMLLFLIVNAAVSGDLNDNKGLFAFMGLALGFRATSLHGKA